MPALVRPKLRLGTSGLGRARRSACSGLRRRIGRGGRTGGDAPAPGAEVRLRTSLFVSGTDRRGRLPRPGGRRGGRSRRERRRRPHALPRRGHRARGAVLGRRDRDRAHLPAAAGRRRDRLHDRAAGDPRVRPARGRVRAAPRVRARRLAARERRLRQRARRRARAPAGSPARWSASRGARRPASSSSTSTARPGRPPPSPT